MTDERRSSTLSDRVDSISWSIIVLIPTSSVTDNTTAWQYSNSCKQDQQQRLPSRGPDSHSEDHLLSAQPVAGALLSVHTTKSAVSIHYVHVFIWRSRTSRLNDVELTASQFYVVSISMASVKPIWTSWHMKAPWYLNFIKSSWAVSCVCWLNITEVSGTVSALIVMVWYELRFRKSHLHNNCSLWSECYISSLQVSPPFSFITFRTLYCYPTSPWLSLTLLEPTQLTTCIGSKQNWTGTTVVTTFSQLTPINQYKQASKK